MVRKDGYFSITDACIKLCRASFLIVRPNKIKKKKLKKIPLDFLCVMGRGQGRDVESGCSSSSTWGKCCPWEDMAGGHPWVLALSELSHPCRLLYVVEGGEMLQTAAGSGNSLKQNMQ